MFTRLVPLAVVLSLALTDVASAQISPPGLGAANTASWFALGARQELDRDHRRQSLTYVGVGSVSHQGGDLDPLREHAIAVLNEELTDHFAKHWQYSVAVSYRRQHRGAAIQQELRSYARFAHIAQAGRFKVTQTFRPELRSFVDARFRPTDEPLELRFRFRSQLAVELDDAARQRVIGSAEFLTATSREQSPRRSRELSYRESRFCLTYSMAREDWPVTVSVGYMNNLLGRAGELRDVHYLALDMIWENPFGVRQSHQ